MNMKYSAKMTEKEREEAVQEYLNTDITLKDLAAKYNCSKQAIHRYVKLYRGKRN